MEIKIELLDDELKLPIYAKEDDAALDLPSRENLTIKPGEKVIVKSGIKMAIPKGYVGVIWDRSSMAVNYSLHTIAGVIDSGYRGEIGVVMVNLSDKDIKIEKKMRIAQIIIQPILQCKVTQVESMEDETDRGDGKFGSTGKFQ